MIKGFIQVGACKLRMDYLFTQSKQRVHTSTHQNIETYLLKHLSGSKGEAQFIDTGKVLRKRSLNIT